MKRFILLTFVLSIIGIEIQAQTYPEVLSHYVFIQDVEEHKIIISTPYGFGTSEKEYDNIHAWADWACKQYKRYAVGPIQVWQDKNNDNICSFMPSLESLDGYLATDDKDKKTMNNCQQLHLFICAIH